MKKKDLFELNVAEPDVSVLDASRAKWDSIAKPIDGLGDFEKLVARIASIQGSVTPDLSKRALVIMCADNGVTAEGVTQTDSSVTADVARLMGRNKSTVGVMTEGLGIDIFPVDIGVDTESSFDGVLDRKVRWGTRNLAREAAMTEEECLLAISYGMDMAAMLADKGYGIVLTGEMGIGNTTTSTALYCALTGTEPSVITGRGAGLSDEGLQRKVRVIESALSYHGLGDYDRPSDKLSDKCGDKDYVLRCLSCVGGLDIAGLCGLFIGCALHRLPIVIDGFISAVAAFTAELLVPGVKAYMLSSHSGREKGTGLVLDSLGLKPVICADMALGEGSGAVMLIPLLDMAMKLYATGTVFSDTDIEGYKRF